MSEPPQAASTDLYPDLYSLITIIQISLSLPLPSSVSLSLLPVLLVKHGLYIQYFVFLNTRNAIFLFAEIKLKPLNHFGVVRFVNDPFRPWRQVRAEGRSEALLSQ